MYQFIFGLLFGVFSVAALMDISPNSYSNIVNTALKECEKSLPRDQHCKIVAIPVIPTKE
jgi:hypothetical protein